MDALGLEDAFCSVILAPPGTPFDVAAASIETFGTKIIPALRG